MLEIPVKYQHKQFKRSFISEVRIYISLENEDAKVLFSHRKEEIRQFFLRFFDADVDSDEFVEKGITFDNGKGVRCDFYHDYISVEIKRNAYKSFITTGFVVSYSLRRFVFKVLGLKHVNSPVIFKRNLFPFQTKPGMPLPTPKELWPDIFSSEFLKTPVERYAAVNGASAKVELRTIKDNGIEVGFATGIVSPTEDAQESFGVILDIFDAFDDKVEIRDDNFDEMILSLNDRLFDYFNWTVTEEIRSLMDRT